MDAWIMRARLFLVMAFMIMGRGEDEKRKQRISKTKISVSDLCKKKNKKKKKKVNRGRYRGGRLALRGWPNHPQGHSYCRSFFFIIFKFKNFKN
jgi:hypothetical protein